MSTDQRTTRNVSRVGIMQHFGMKLLSTSDPVLIPSIKTPTPLRSGFPSSSQPSSSNKQPRTAFVHMPHPETNKSIFEDPSDIEMDELPARPTNTLQNKSSLHSLNAIRSTMRLGKCPIRALPQVPQLSPYNMPRIPQMPIDPFFPPRPHPKKPYHLGEDISEMGTGTRYGGIKYRDPERYWITCRMDNTGVEFATWVARDFVIDLDPQDMISWINRVGMLLGVWSGRLLGLFYRPKRHW